MMKFTTPRLDVFFLINLPVGPCNNKILQRKGQDDQDACWRSFVKLLLLFVFFWWIYNYTDCELLDDTLRIFQKLIKIYINKRDLSCGLSGGFKHSIAPAGLNGSIRGFFGGHCECSRQMAVT